MKPARPPLRLEAVAERETVVPILLEADEEVVLRSYLDQGDLYRVVVGDDVIGAVLFMREGAAVEIKNLALVEPFRGRGLGRATIEAVANVARGSGATRLTVGTADATPGTITFYRRVGFRDAGRIEGFFDAYPEPVVEDGVVAHNMVRFEMDL